MHEQIGGERHRRAVEVAAGDDLARRRRTPSGCRSRRWPRSSSDVADEARARRAPRRAPAARSASSRRPARGRSCSCDALMPLPSSSAQQVGGRRRLPGDTAAASWMRGSNGCIEPRSASIDSAAAMSAARARRSAPASASASDRGRRLRAVDEREPFLRPERRPASRPARGAAPSAPVSTVGSSPTVASPSPMRTSARCASGARSPLAPTEPRLGTRGWTPRLSSASSRSSVSRRMPEKPLASTLARSAIDARTARTGSGSPTPAAWLRSRLSCSAPSASRGIARLGERAEAGVDAVDRRRRRRPGDRRRRATAATRAARVRRERRPARSRRRWRAARRASGWSRRGGSSAR